MSLKQLLAEIIPKASCSKHKGEAGRLCVVGGSQDYTGAPYFSAMAAMRMGADLCTVVCDKDASFAIKAYSPDIMVTPLFDMNKSSYHEAKFDQWLKETLPRFSAIICGPGLSRDEYMLEKAQIIITQACKCKIPLVLDGDALYLFSLPSLRNNNPILNNKNCILTPNAMEFRRLWINFILKQDINKFKDNNNEYYLPPFDVNDLFDIIQKKNNNETKQKNNKNENTNENDEKKKTTIIQKNTII